jgi:arylsulfatase A-like enzyme
MDKLGIADNTILIVMGDNGHFTKYSPESGFTPMIFRGGKGDTTEGGVRVDAFVRWPGMIEADSIVGDIIHVTDLFTTLARFAGSADKIPTDRLIDGLDQTALMLVGETHGRRDYVFIYSGNKLEAVVKERFKIKVPGPGENPIGAKFYDLYRDTREEFSVSTEVGAWGGAEFVRVIKRHMMRKQKYPDVGPALGRPYDGVDNLRPETKAAVEAFLYKQKAFDM